MQTQKKPLQEKLDRINWEIENVGKPLPGHCKYAFYRKMFLNMVVKTDALAKWIAEVYGGLEKDCLPEVLSFQQKNSVDLLFFDDFAELYLLSISINRKSFEIANNKHGKKQKHLYEVIKINRVDKLKFSKFINLIYKYKLTLDFDTSPLWRALRHQYTTAVMTLLILTEQMKQESLNNG